MLKRLLGLFFIITLFVTSVSAEGQQTLIISEIMPNPAGNDTLLEWIELQNQSSQYLQLNNFSLGDSSLPELTLYPGEYIILARNSVAFSTAYSGFNGQLVQFSFSLGNSGADLFLKQNAGGNVIQQFSYGAAQEGKSFELLEGNCLEIAINADSDTAGTVNTGCNDNLLPAPAAQEPNIIISSALPAPLEGEEWLELTNLDEIQQDLSGWEISDASGAVYTIGAKIIGSKSVLKFNIAPVSLNNSGDTITLREKSGKRVDIFSYSASKKGGVVGITNTPVSPITETTSETNECPAVLPAAKQPLFELELAVPRLYL